MAHHDKVPWIKTPLVRSAALSRSAGCNIYLKLENLQPSGSFKSRGIGNFCLSHLSALAKENQNQNQNQDAKPRTPHFYIASGGNAGLGCVHAAVTLGCPATIIVPNSTTQHMISKLRDAGATEVIQRGDSWAEADRFLADEVIPQAKERGEDAVYVPPFDSQQVWDGNAGIALEIAEQLREVDAHYAVDVPSHVNGVKGVNGTNGVSNGTNGTNGIIHPPNIDALVCSVGGGGLFSGIMQGLDESGMGGTRVLAMETLGADSLSQAVRAGKLVTLPAITSIATSLGARTVCKKAFDYACRDTVTPVVLTDAEAMDGCRRLADDERIMVEPACGVCAAVCYEGRLKKLIPGLNRESKVVIVVCGGSNISLDLMGSI